MCKELRKQLENLKSELQLRILKATTSLTSKHSPDWSEQATERENDEVLVELVREAQEELEQIHKALVSMDSGKYGRCENCGNDINSERLSAMPMSTLCISCATQRS